MPHDRIPVLGRKTAHGAVPRPQSQIDQLFASQHALISRHQALVAGLSDDQIFRLVKTGRWDRPQAGVYGVAGVPYTPERTLLAGCLSARVATMTFGRSASWMWRMTPGRQPASYEVVIHRGAGRPRLKGITLHRFSDTHLTEPVWHRGVPCTSPLRTAVDLGAVAPFDTVRDAIVAAHRLKLFRMPAVIAELHRVARPGRDGAGVLRRVLDELNVLGQWTPSRLELKARELFRRAGLPEPLSEVVWGDDGEYRLDFYWPQFALVVEVDGWSFHASDAARRHDLRRQNKLVLAGLGPLRYTWADIVRDGGRVVREVRRHQSTLGTQNRAQRG